MYSTSSVHNHGEKFEEEKPYETINLESVEENRKRIKKYFLELLPKWIHSKIIGL